MARRCGAAGDETALARMVLDYVAGMTDRFAIQEHERLCRNPDSPTARNRTDAR